MIDAAFWRQRRVLVTGHTGFKGGWLSLWLQRLGAEVFGLAMAPPTSPNLFQRAHVGDGMVDLQVDVRDLAGVSRAVQQCRPDVVFHLAAQPLVRLSYRDPVSTYATNVMGTLHVLEAARHVDSIRAIVVVTSDKCYENREWTWGYRENDPLGGHDPYSSSKGCAELVTAAYRRSFFSTLPKPVGVASVRAGNVIGGGDWAADRLVPDILRALQCGQEIVVRNPLAVRPWQHVLEPLHGYLMLAERLVENPTGWSEAWNFGPRDADARPVQDVVQQAIALWGSGSWQAPPAGHAPHEDRLLKLDCSQAGGRLHWQPLLRLETALQWIVQWHRAELAGGDMRQLTWQQIHDYETLAANPDVRPADESFNRKQNPCEPPSSPAVRATEAA